MHVAIDIRVLRDFPRLGTSRCLRDWLRAAHEQPSALHARWALALEGQGLQFQGPVYWDSLGGHPGDGRGFLGKWRWMRRLPGLLRQAGADWLVSGDGLLPPGLDLPACLLLPEPATWMELPPGKGGLPVYYRKRLTESIGKARLLLVTSEYSRQQYISRLRIPEKDLLVWQPPVPELFRPVNWMDRHHLKMRFAEGREYFLYSGDVGDETPVIPLMKAFSKFKKFQQSNLKLILHGRMLWREKEWGNILGTYKYRDDVAWLEPLPEEDYALLLGAAFARIFPVLEEFHLPELRRTRACETPVVSVRHAYGEADGPTLWLSGESTDPLELDRPLVDVYRRL